MQSPSTDKSGLRNVSAFLDDFVGAHRVHAKSLISTFFGDVVVPADGFTWVETITAALAPLGVNERLVRTSLYRLREEGWVEATRSGRKSYYQLTDHAASQTRLAEQLIYYRDTPQWDGCWTLLFFVLEPIQGEVRSELVQELEWIGFGRVIKHVWAHPGDKRKLVADRIDHLGLTGKVICMRCENIFDEDLGFTADDRRLAELCLPISGAETGYQQFVQAFAPLLADDCQLLAEPSPAEALSLRLLMMDEFRRVILRDRHLPAELLPEDWAGQQAFNLCGAVYHKLARAAASRYSELQSKAGNIQHEQSVGDYSMRFSGIG